METTENLKEQKSGTNGFSSEELDKLTNAEGVVETPEAEVKKETVPVVVEQPQPPPAETPPVSPEPQKDKAQAGLISTVTELRQDKRTLKQRVAELESQLSRPPSAVSVQPTGVEKSPIEIEAEQQGISVDDIVVSGKLFREQRRWEQQQEIGRQNQQVIQSAVVAERKIAVEMSPEKMGQGLDIKTITTIGNQYLTEGDRIDVARKLQIEGAESALKFAYEQSKYRILTSGTEDADLLREAIAQNSQTQQKKPEIVKKPVGQPQKIEEPERISLRPNTSEIIDLMFAK